MFISIVQQVAWRKKTGLWNQIDMGVNLNSTTNLLDFVSLTPSRHQDIHFAELAGEFDQQKHVKVHRLVSGVLSKAELQ